MNRSMNIKIKICVTNVSPKNLLQKSPRNKNSFMHSETMDNNQAQVLQFRWLILFDFAFPKVNI
jgi:hypothetical protein